MTPEEEDRARKFAMGTLSGNGFPQPIDLLSPLIAEIDSLRAALAESQSELRLQTTFNAAFADKLKELGTVDRLVEEYSRMKQEVREAKTALAESEARVIQGASMAADAETEAMVLKQQLAESEAKREGLLKERAQYNKDFHALRDDIMRLAGVEARELALREALERIHDECFNHNINGIGNIALEALKPAEKGGVHDTTGRPDNL